MEARIARSAIALAVLFVAAQTAAAANFSTKNFVVETDNPQVARIVAETAEKYRRELAIEWLGQEMPDWSKPCPIKVQVGPNLGAGGATSFVFDRGEVFGWKMNIQGPMDRLLDSVLPHEVTHTIFATYFRQPLPRWADEGACTTVEHDSERGKQQRMLIQFLQTGRGISFSQMFRMKEYPNDVLPLYAQGHSLATYLIGKGGKARYLQFLAAGLENEDWVTALREFYGIETMSSLQNTWLDWVAAGSPPVQPDSMTEIAATRPAAAEPDDITYRGQDPDVRLAGATSEIPGYASNRNRQAPPAASEWRPSNVPPTSQDNGQALPAGLNPVRGDNGNSGAQAPAQRPPMDSAAKTKLLLEWSRARNSGSTGQSKSDSRSNSDPGRTILR